MVAHARRVAGDARDAGLGAAAEAGAARAPLEMGIDLVEWTYDPLQALNAHLNFAKLGVVVEEYEENIYGESSSPLHRGSPTDRFVAEWQLREPHVERRISAAGAPLVRDASVASAPLVNPSKPGGHGWRRARRICRSTRGACWSRFPVGFAECQLDDPALALEWRMATRADLPALLRRGYRVVDFFLSREAGRGHYLLARAD